MRDSGFGSRTLQFTIGLLITLALGCALLLPLHQRFTQVIPLPPASASGSYELLGFTSVAGEAHRDLELDETLSLHRYSQAFRSELGQARVVSVAHNDDEPVALDLVPGSLIFPSGRQGTLAAQRGLLVAVDLGSTSGRKDGDRMIVFREGQAVGALRLRGENPAIPGQWRAVLEQPIDNAIGLVASEYTVQTVVSRFSAPRWWIAFEVGFFALLAAAELWMFRRRGFGIVAALGQRASSLRGNASAPARARVRRSIALLIAPALCLLASELVLEVIARLRILDSTAVQAFGLRWSVFGVFLVLYAICFASNRRAPLLLLWDALAYTPNRLVRRLTASGGAQRFSAWSLHLVIAFAFAFTLIDFLSANVNAMFQYLAVDDSPLRLVGARLSEPASIPAWLSACAANAALLAREGVANLTFDQTLAVARLALWSVTIVGALIGYVHSVLWIFPWSSIRNVDFTLLGWGTNAICYGPLLGMALWRVIPPAEGVEPVAIAGPLFYVLALVELAFNLLYTASVWNMGTRFGVMVDKGLVESGFFAVIRHPNYTLEAFMFFTMCARGLSAPENWLGVSFYFLIYWLRAEREEVFLNESNPGYDAYRQRVRWKYVPGLI